jgi:hypothetical protein
MNIKINSLCNLTKPEFGKYLNSNLDYTFLSVIRGIFLLIPPALSNPVLVCPAKFLHFSSVISFHNVEVGGNPLHYADVPTKRNKATTIVRGLHDVV